MDIPKKIRECEGAIAHYTDAAKKKPWLKKVYDFTIDWNTKLLEKLKHEQRTKE
jgi:hypothetical protein